MKFKAGECVRIINAGPRWDGKKAVLIKVEHKGIWLAKLGGFNIELPEKEMERLTPLELLL